MAKFATYILVMTGLIVLFYFTGISTDDTANSVLLNLLLDPAQLQNTPLALKAIAVFEAILASAIVVGFAIGGNIELGVMTSFTIYLMNLMWDFIAIYSKVAAQNEVVAVLIFAPLLFLFVVTTIEWWRGVST